MDDEVLAALYRDFQPELLRQLTRRFPWSPDLVEDAVQAAFLKIRTANPVPGNPRGWLQTVARRQVIDGLRAQGRLVSDDGVVDELPADVPTAPGTTTARRPTPTLVQRALGLLTSRAQRLLKGKYEDDKTYGTLARQEGVAKTSIGRLLDRARIRLRRAVEMLRTRQ